MFGGFFSLCPSALLFQDFCITKKKKLKDKDFVVLNSTHWAGKLLTTADRNKLFDYSRFKTEDHRFPSSCCAIISVVAFFFFFFKEPFFTHFLLDVEKSPPWRESVRFPSVATFE